MKSQTTPRSVSWKREKTPEPLWSMLLALGEHYPVCEDGAGPELVFTPTKDSNTLRVESKDAAVHIHYGSSAAAARGVACALGGVNTDSEVIFDALGVMLDCSRNAVMKLSCVKRWLRQLALLGYNKVMLYTEDTYELPGEPYFGYMRGGYTLEEIREIDAYAKTLGIEVIACIQTLGHLQQIFKWPRFAEVRDMAGVLLADEEQTYQLIDKMLDFWCAALSTRRIHLGMDEAHELGRGKFMDRHGSQPPFDIFNRHLARVRQSCESRGLKPMIWSDMYFRMGSATQDYYDRAAVIPDAVKEKIPPGVQLVYWDYYSTEEDFYAEWIRRHRDLNCEPVMASGIWTWSRFWYDHAKTSAAALPCIAACRKAGVRELFFTMWGDGGSYCEFDSAFAGLAWGADLAYGGEGTVENVTPLLAAATGADFATVLLGSEIQVKVEEDIPFVAAITVMWDDPLLGIGWQGYNYAGEDFWKRILAKLHPVREKLLPRKADSGPPDFSYLWHLCDVMIRKIEFREALVPAYRARDRDTIRRLKDENIPAILASLAELEKSFRRQWLRRNKPFGMEVVQIRFGALSTRFRETALRLEELLDGTVDCIPEIDAQRKDIGKNVVDFFDWLAGSSLII